MRPTEPSEPPDRRHSRTNSRTNSFHEDALAITPSRPNEFPPDPDTILYGSYAPPSSIEEEGEFEVERPAADEDVIPEANHNGIQIDEEEEEDEDDEEEELVKPGKVLGNMLRGKAAARLPQRAAAMASRTTRNGPGYGTLATSVTYDQIPVPLYDQEYEVDEEVRIFISGHRWSRPKMYIYYTLCILTGGVLWLLCRWFPRWELALRTARCPLSEASIVAVKNQWNQLQVVPVKREPFAGAVADVFQKSGVSKEGHADNGEDTHNLRDWKLPYLIKFEYRYVQFIFNPFTGQYEPNLYWRDYRWTSVDRVVKGLYNDDLVEQRKKIFGQNAVEIKEKPIFRLLMDEVLHPFYVFQVASIILWSLDDYYFYAACIFIISTTSAMATLFETRETMRRMRELSRFSCEVRVLRQGQWRVMRSEEIVPGDVYEVSSSMLQVYPCDGVLLDGDCIVNESMLTGESVPVSKTPIKDVELRTLDIWEEDPASSSRMSRFFLFAGTKIIRVRPGSRSGTATPVGPDPSLQYGQAGALALAVRTGFNTTKGSLVRSMLFPKPNSFKFYRDSFRFIGVLAIIAGLGFIGSFYNFVVLGVAGTMILIRALDLITIVVPPALPATMAIGTSFAIGRLRKGDVYCTSPPRVNICGKLDLMAFDKTGTLTEEGLDVLGFRFTVPSNVIADTPVEAVAVLEGPLRFSALYRSVDAVIPPGALHIQGEASPAEWVPPIENGGMYDPPSRALSGLSVSLGVIPGHPNGSEPDFPYPLIVCAMSTCHSIKVVNGELIGDPMDVKMFEFTGWHIEEGGSAGGRKSGSATPERGALPRKGPDEKAVAVIVRPPDPVEFKRAEWGLTGKPKPERKVYTELGIIRSFEFVSGLRRMSVIVRRLRFLQGFMFPSQSGFGLHDGFAENGPVLAGEKEFEVFVKGAPEVMRAICLPESLPADYEQQLNDYAHHGYRVIACAWRRIEGISYHKVMRMKREAVERDLQFLGFIIFENKLKPGTAPVVEALRKARIREVMCTGDNILTAISVSRECGLVDPHEKTFVPHFLPGAPPTSEDAQIVWEDVDGSGATLDSETLLPKTGPKPLRNTLPLQSMPDFLRQSSLPSYEELDGASSTRSDTEEFIVDVNSIAAKVGEYNLAVTGDVFQWMLEFGSDDSFNRMLVKGQIYARMSPDQKHFLVENFQELGYCTGFCGDGANDCGALKSADVGLSLSEAEASVAAPFTSRSTDLECVLRVIREGRAALVTSFSCFKYMALYSLIQFTSVSLLYSLAGNLGDFQFLYIDLALIIPIAVFMGRSGAHPRIYRKRPTASLVSRKVLTSLICQVIIQAAFQVWVFLWVRRQPWYRPPRGHVDDKIYTGYENTVVFLLSCFQYIAVAAAFCVGPPYRESMWKNVPFLTTVTLLVAFSTYITLYPSPFISSMLDLVDIPFSGRLVVFGLGVADWIVTWTGEHWVFPAVAKAIKGAGVGKRALVAGRGGTAPGGEAAAARKAKMEVKRERWRKKGKIYKLVMDDMKTESCNGIS
ncbi:HAD ATPase, P-type, family IC [Spizellomyces punctatus DAOM BR117]|uniref:Cation-transporting ATPase n=1 Tax=Spizellomyces punctatus (strain DAOM BR117) TaxID=645134 RepID=A0A0L0HI45_SPIPD|nr:HAD ATPase, P-type, family IC [Spizellomyces punctatus DAOM BR117]KND00499.1 HAD ATPase, P-type, family IC [Spizellomyces punctatus DAOM BR117]|eukprot:XP_016608538.1 HAD ATPase, P-type, family IC [Spizellomyces punctatus DAOM BR117]